MANATLLALPNEVLLKIAAGLPQLRDVNALSQCTRRLYEALGQELYTIDAKAFNCRALFWAALNGSCAAARKSILAGTDVDTYCGSSDCLRDWDSREQKHDPDATPLLVAAANGHYDVFSLLLNSGADQGWMDSQDDTALHIACRYGHVDIARLLLSRSTADINIPNRNCTTPLILATNHGHLEVVNLLLSYDCIDVDASDEEGTALFHAGQAGRESIFNAIHDRGATVAGMALVKNIPDMTAVCGLKVSRALTLAEEMLDLGFQDDADLTGEMTPLMSACGAGNAAVVRMLLARNVDISAQDSEGKTALHFACRLQDPEIAELLLERGADPKAGRGYFRFTALHHACRTGSLAIVKMLLDKGANPAIHSTMHITAFDEACRRKDSNFLALLLAHSSDVDLDKALKSACGSGRVQPARLLLDAGANPHQSTSLLSHACAPMNDMSETRREELLALVAVLLDAGVDIEGSVDTFSTRPSARRPSARRPLHIACENGFEQLFDLLLSRGATIKPPEEGFKSLLHCACKSGNVSIVKKLLARGLDPLVIEEEKTTLYMACQAYKTKGAAEIVDILLERGVDPGRGAGQWNLTPLSQVCSGRPLESGRIVKRLLAAGVDCDATYDYTRTTALRDACLAGQFESAQALIQQGASLESLVRGETDPLFFTADFSLLKLLMSLGVDVVDFKPPSTAILDACATTSLRACRELVNRGADPFTTAPGNETALLLASIAGTRRFVEYLIGLGLDPNPPIAKNGSTPLLTAAECGRLNVVQLLVETCRVDLHVRDDAGMTAFDLAQGDNRKVVCDYLVSKGCGPAEDG